MDLWKVARQRLIPRSFDQFPVFMDVLQHPVRNVVREPINNTSYFGSLNDDSVRGQSIHNAAADGPPSRARCV